MGADDRDQLEYKISQLLNEIAKEILTVLEANAIGKTSAAAETEDSDNFPDKAKSIDREFQFIRKRVLDSINGTKRTISSLLKRFEIEKPDMTINVRSGSRH